MATTTPNFGWPVPTSTDLVKDGATAIEALGDSIDASLLDLKGGTTGQVLSKNSNTDMDFTWVTDAAGDITGVTAGTGISGGGTSGTVTVTNSMATAIDAKGDLVVGTGADAFSRLAVGTNGQVLTADSAEATGLKWASAAGGGMTLISTTSLTGSTVTLNSFSGYTDLQLVIIGAYGSNQNTIHARFNGDSSSLYYESLNVVGTGESVRNKAGLGDGLSSSSTNVTLRNYTVLTIQRYAESGGKPYQVDSGYIYWNNTAIEYLQMTNNIYASSTAITSIDIFLASGSFSGGTAYLYGVK